MFFHPVSYLKKLINILYKGIYSLRLAYTTRWSNRQCNSIMSNGLQKEVIQKHSSFRWKYIIWWIWWKIIKISLKKSWQSFRGIWKSSRIKTNPNWSKCTSKHGIEICCLVWWKCAWIKWKIPFNLSQ